MNILLCCSAGMSTSLLVTKMQQSAKQKGIDATIWAVSIDEVGKEIDKADIVLLGPQIKFLRGEVEPLLDGKPLEVIPMRDYGMLNGEGVLDLAIKLLEK